MNILLSPWILLLDRLGKWGLEHETSDQRSLIEAVSLRPLVKSPNSQGREAFLSENPFPTMGPPVQTKEAQQ